MKIIKSNRDQYLRRVYGISLRQYNLLLKKQNDCCAICGKHKDKEARNFAVDHDHKTRRIRGVLCMYCNHRLVGRHTDAKLLRRIADYVESGTDWFVPEKKRRKR